MACWNLLASQANELNSIVLRKQRNTTGSRELVSWWGVGAKSRHCAARERGDAKNKQREQMMETITANRLYDKLKSVSSSCEYTMERCRHLAPIVNNIMKLKSERNAVVLAHTYVHPDIIYTIADYVGDSYGLAKQAMDTSADVIIFPAVRFMAETAKILNPSKVVLDPNPDGGCSLADSITKEDVEDLRRRYPDHTFVCYVNTTAQTKALCDVCVTSSNVYTVVKNIPNDKIVFLPDKLMGLNLKNWLHKHGIEKEVILYEGTCYVHEQFTTDDVSFVRETNDDVCVLAHPECRPEVVAQADVVGSTSMMYDYVKEHGCSQKYLLLTECGLGARLKVEMPDVELKGSCMICRYMKNNSLSLIEKTLRNPVPDNVVDVDENLRTGALKTLEAMFRYSNA